jgi:hypothetical protein
VTAQDCTTTGLLEDDIDEPRGLDLGSGDLGEIVEVADPDVVGALELLTLLAAGADDTAKQYLTTVPAEQRDRIIAGVWAVESAARAMRPAADTQP